MIYKKNKFIVIVLILNTFFVSNCNFKPETDYKKIIIVSSLGVAGLGLFGYMHNRIKNYCYSKKFELKDKDYNCKEINFNNDSSVKTVENTVELGPRLNITIKKQDEQIYLQDYLNVGLGSLFRDSAGEKNLVSIDEKNETFFYRMENKNDKFAGGMGFIFSLKYFKNKKRYLEYIKNNQFWYSGKNLSISLRASYNNHIIVYKDNTVGIIDRKGKQVPIFQVKDKTKYSRPYKRIKPDNATFWQKFCWWWLGL